MWGWDDRPGSSAGSLRLSQHDEATASTAKIIPLRPWFDPPPSRVEDPHVEFADENGGPADARTADVKTADARNADVKTAEPASVEPFRREKARTEVKAEVKTEAKPEIK